MASEEWSKRVVSALHALGKRRFGALTEAERKAQVFPSYVRKRKDAGTIDLRKMLAVLEAFNEHPARFFRRVFPNRENDYRTFIEPPTGPQPDIIEQAQRRMASSSPSSIPRSHLEELDRLRYDEPERAKQGVVSALDFVSHDDVAFALGVWASAQRMLLNLSEAGHGLHAGLDIADSKKDLLARGDLLQRLACVVADNGMYAEALALATGSTDARARTGDLHAVGRSLVSRGEWLYYLEHYEESIAMHRQALPLLAPFDHIHKATVWQDTALCLRAQGNHEEASKALQHAWAFAEAIGKLNRSKLLWLDAVIDCDRQAFDLGEEKLLAVVKTLSTLHRGEAALATVDLVETQILSGKTSLACQSARTILPLITTLSAKNPVIRSVETVLLGMARIGEAQVTIEHAEALRTAVGSLKGERHLWRSLSKGLSLPDQ